MTEDTASEDADSGGHPSHASLSLEQTCSQHVVGSKGLSGNIHLVSCLIPGPGGQTFLSLLPQPSLKTPASVDGSRQIIFIYSPMRL